MADALILQVTGPSLSIANGDCASHYEFKINLRSLLSSVRISDEDFICRVENSGDPFADFNVS